MDDEWSIYLGIGLLFGWLSNLPFLIMYGAFSYGSLVFLFLSLMMIEAGIVTVYTKRKAEEKNVKK